MKPIGSIAAVISAVRDEAAWEVERIERAAEAEVQAAQRQAGSAPAAPHREVRLAGARREARERLLHEDEADARAALEVRERWLRAAVALGQSRLSGPEPREARRALLARLAQEGIGCLPGSAFEVLVSPTDAPLLDESWCSAFGGNVRVAQALMGGGCVVRTADGRMAVDNGFEARARRTESAWRAALGRIYGA